MSPRIGAKALDERFDFWATGRIIGFVTERITNVLGHYRTLKTGHYLPNGSTLVSFKRASVRTLAEYGVHAEYRRDMPGVWVGDDKIVAIGVRIESWVTYHGFAFNVNTNMRHWRLIVPCGIADKGVTSLSNVLGRTVDVDALVPVVARYFGEVFGVDMRQRQLDELVAQGV